MKTNHKGFTLAELLIVVAIIAVLTAIAIPVFSGNMEKAREGADAANLRAAYAMAAAKALDLNGKNVVVCDITLKQTESFNKLGNDPIMIGNLQLNSGNRVFTPGTSWALAYKADDGKVAIGVGSAAAASSLVVDLASCEMISFTAN